ncbi:hypothetical protein ACFL4C_04605, partial [Candidatus Omnitrophota bacterium]
MLNNTALNPDFVITEIDKLDVSSLTEEVFNEYVPKGELPEEFSTALINTITRLEPIIKEKVSAITYPVYDYLLGKSESIDLALTLRNNVLNRDFAISLIDELNISTLAGEFLSEQLTKELPE